MEKNHVDFFIKKTSLLTLRIFAVILLFVKRRLYGKHHKKQVEVRNFEEVGF